MPWRRIGVAAATAAAALVSGCAGVGGAASGGKVSGDRLAVYTSVPLHGTSAGAGRDVLRGEQLALEQTATSTPAECKGAPTATGPKGEAKLAGCGSVGDFAIPLYKLDEADPTATAWSARHVADNSRIALSDSKTIGFLGEVDPGASAISIPLFDEAGIVQISPTDTYGGLTVKEGDQAGEPDRFYPRHDRMFARTVANDLAQADLITRWIQSSGAKHVATIKDSPLYGEGLADDVQQRLELPRSGVSVSDGGSVEANATPAQLTQLATKLASGSNPPDAVVYGGTNPVLAARVFRALHRALPQADLYAPGALGVPAFLTRLGPAAADTRITLPVAPSGGEQEKFAAKFKSKYGSAPTAAAAYGYTAMQTLLQALQAAGSKARQRSEVINQVFKLTDHPSPFGSLTINDEDPTSPAVTPGKGDVKYDGKPATFVPYTVGAGGRLRQANVPQTNS